MVSTQAATAVFGYQGKINDASYPKIMGAIGVAQSFVGMAPTAAASTRQVQVAAGSATSRGVRAEFGAATIDIPVPGTGGQWYLIAVHRRVGDKLGQIEVLTGPTGTDAAQTLPPVTSLPSGWISNVGVEEYQALAWVYSRVGAATVDVVDLRLMQAGVGTPMAQNLSGLAAAKTFGSISFGAMIQVAGYGTRTGGVHENSRWSMRADGVVMPFGRITISGTAALAEIQQLAAAGGLGLYNEDQLLDNATQALWKWQQSSVTFVSLSPPLGDSSTKIATTEWVQSNTVVRVLGLDGLWNLMDPANPARPLTGQEIHVGYGTWYGITHYASKWRVTGDRKAEPINGIPILVKDQASLANLEYNFKNNGALFAQRFNFDHMNTAVVVGDNGNYNAVKLEYRWDSVGYITGRTGFKLWPGAGTLFRLDFRAATDQQLAGNGYTNLVYDTWDANPLGCSYGGSGGYSVTFPERTEGRWGFRFNFAVTGDDQTERWLATCYNQTTSDDETTGSPGLYNYRPMICTGEQILGQQNSLNTAVQRSGSGNQWRARWNAQYNKNRWSMWLIGWV